MISNMRTLSFSLSRSALVENQRERKRKKIILFLLREENARVPLAMRKNVLSLSLSILRRCCVGRDVEENFFLTQLRWKKCSKWKIYVTLVFLSHLMRFNQVRRNTRGKNI